MYMSTGTVRPSMPPTGEQGGGHHLVSHSCGWLYCVGVGWQTKHRAIHTDMSYIYSLCNAAVQTC